MHEFNIKFNTMTSSQCVSVTELRTQTKKCLDGLAEEPKYIFQNNKPIAVIMHIKDYENMFEAPVLKLLPKNQISEEMLIEAKKALKTPLSQLHDI